MAPSSQHKQSALATARLAATSRHLASSSVVASTTGNADKNGNGVNHHSKIKNVTLFGAGLMGAGIAQIAAQTGFKVTLCDMTQQAIDNGVENIITKSLIAHAARKHPSDEAEQKRFVSSALANIATTTDTVAAVKSADLVVEAIIENVEIKKDLFALLDKNAPKGCLFASNTSSLSITDIASSCSKERRQLFGGLHFFNPVPQMKLVEVIRTPTTLPSTHETFLAFSKAVGKVPVSCGDTPGFIVNRLLVPYMAEAVRMLERGDASAKDIDIAMKLGAGHPMGPIELTDVVGLDTSKQITDGWRARIEAGHKTGIPSELVQESPLMAKLVNEGKLGRKTGEGFYKYGK